jgi:hypothetical protein
MIRNCLSCGTPFEVNLKHGKKQRYCGATCRQRARRARIVDFFVDAPRETETPAPLRSNAELSALVNAEVEMIQHRADFVGKLVEYAVEDGKLIAEAEASGHPAWRYQMPEEVDVKEAKKAFDEFDRRDLWCAWFD